MSHATTAETTRERAESAIGEGLRNLAISEGRPSRALFGVLPVRRIVPQDMHSLADYANGVRVMTAGLLTHERDARVASLALGLSIINVSSLTDYRLGLFRLIPIEAHEAIDYLWGASAIAAPFVLGYRKRAPVTATLHIIIGAAHLLTSLFTDYRAARSKKVG
jgi:hypothetical protein